jgi:TRAP-type C4-dicarboxylate transport system substrate-binding protein
MRGFPVKTSSIVLLLCATALANAQEKVRIGDYTASKHFVGEAGLKPWMAEVTEATKGKVVFEHYPGQQLGKAADMLRLTQSNVAQIANITVSMAGDKLELAGVAELPGMFDSACQGTMAFLKAGRQGPIADEFQAAGVRLVYPVVYRSLQAFSREKPLNTVASFQGQKLMVPMRPAELMLGSIGAVTQRLTSGPEAYQGMQRGMVDSVILQPEAVYTYDMLGIVKHATENGKFGALVSLYLINLQTWNKFDDATKAAIDAASEKAAKRACEAVDAGFVSVFQRMRKDGVQVTVYPQDELRKFDAASQAARKQWVDGLAQRGKKSAETLALMLKAAEGAK